jgi:iron complex transport system substrate-binding protein
MRPSLRTALRMSVAVAALAAATATTACPRIVSQSPYITRALDWFGAGDCIVGVSRYDKRPLPRTGGVIDPDADAIAALKPDVVIGSDWADADVLRRATPAGALALRVGGFHSMAETEEMLRQVGQAAGVADAERRVAEFHRQWQQAAARVDGHGRRALVLSACSGTPYSYGSGTTLNDLLSSAGFAMVEDQPGIRMIADADAIDALVGRLKPELIVALDQRTADSCQLIYNSDKVRIVHVDGELLNHPGPGLLDGLARLRRELEHE